MRTRVKGRLKTRIDLHTKVCVCMYVFLENVSGAVTRIQRSWNLKQMSISKASSLVVSQMRHWNNCPTLSQAPRNSTCLRESRLWVQTGRTLAELELWFTDHRVTDVEKQPGGDVLSSSNPLLTVSVHEERSRWWSWGPFVLHCASWPWSLFLVSLDFWARWETTPWVFISKQWVWKMVSFCDLPWLLSL